MIRSAKQTLINLGITRPRVAAARMCCERHLLAALPGARRRYIGRILCYHSLGQEEWGTNDVTPTMFRRHIELALNAGYRFVPASEIARTGGGPKELAISFDDGLRSVLTHAAPILEDYNLPWTFFPVSNWAEGIHWLPDNEAFLSWQDIESLLNQGAEMGSHSVTHPDFSKISLDQAADELGDSREMFRKRLGFAPDSFAIPFGQSMNWTSETAAIAREVGYATIYAQAEDTRPCGTIPRTFVTKFDGDFIFSALLRGKFDKWEEWC